MDYVAIIVNVLILAALFFITIVLARRFRNGSFKKCIKVTFILILTIPLYGLLSQLDNGAMRQLMFHYLGDAALVRRLLYSIPLTISLSVPLIALMRVDRAAKLAVTLILILAPLVPITIAQAVVIAVKKNHSAGTATAKPLTETAGGRPRVLWLIFDEFDYRIAFEQRPATVKLPELDRLAASSLFAENAYPPAGETFLTMPALISGKLVSEARRKGSNDLMINFGEDGVATAWSTQPNVFSRARELGFNTALVGWRQPYCRILGSSLTKCAWEGYESFVQEPGLTPYLYAHAVNAVPVTELFFEPTIDVRDAVRKKHLADFTRIYRQAIDAATDPNLGLVMVHWPIPHPPTIYDRSTAEISVSAGNSYLDNLELVDRTLGVIRRAMENNGTWDNTIVLVSSDHWWRAEYFWKGNADWTPEEETAWGGTIDRRIPFILKVNGEERVSFAPPFNTVLTHDLVMAILRAEVIDTKSAATWLEQHRSIGRSPYDNYHSEDALLGPTESLIRRIMRPKPKNEQ